MPHVPRRPLAGVLAALAARSTAQAAGGHTVPREMPHTADHDLSKEPA